MGTPKYTRVRRGNPCPICGSDHWCATASESESINQRTGEVRWDPPFVTCMRRGAGSTPENPGYEFVRTIRQSGRSIAPNATANKWVLREHIANPPRTRDPKEWAAARASIIERERRQAGLEAKRQAKKGRWAGMIWQQAKQQTFGPDGSLTSKGTRLLTYLHARGVQVDAARGLTLPASIAFHETCPDEQGEWPAMVAKVVVPDSEHEKGVRVVAIHRTFLSQVSDGKREGEHGEAKKVLGPSGGGTIRLLSDGAITAAFPKACGVLLLGEGIETVLCAQRALATRGLHASAWACISAVGLHRMFFDESQFGPSLYSPEELDAAERSRLEAVRDAMPAFAGDPQLVQGLQLAAPSEKRAADVKAWVDASGLRLLPYHTVLIAADLDESGTGQRHACWLAERLAHSHPWLRVEVVLPRATRFPKLVETGYLGQPIAIADDHGERPDLDWADLCAMTDRAVVGQAFLDRWTPNLQEIRNAWHMGREVASETMQELAAARREVAGVVASADAAKPGAAKASDTKAAVKPDGQFVGKIAENRIVTGLQPDGSIVLPMNSVDIARLFLLLTMSPVKTAGSGFYLRRWTSGWYEYDGRKWNALSDEHLSARVRNWLNTCWQVKYDKKQDSNVLSRVTPSQTLVNEVMASLHIDTAVMAEDLPVWVPASFDEAGNPRWGTACVSARERASLPPARDIIAFRNGLLDAKAWTQGVIRFMPHTPTWFSTTVLPFDLPVEELAALDMSDAKGVADWMMTKAPSWFAFLDDVAADDEWVRCLQQFFGYLLVDTTIMEKILMIVGPQRSGKGTIDSVASAMLGAENVTTTSFQQLCERFHMSTLMGKKLYVMTDAHMGRFTDVPVVVEKLKSISGGDPQLVEWKGVKNMPSVRLTGKFIIYANQMPELKDSSTALAGRIVALPMTKSVFGKEDRTLKPRCVAEAAGVMLWALFGLRDLWSRMEKGLGFSEPEVGREFSEEFKRSSSPAAAFVADCLEFVPIDPTDETGGVLCSRLYSLWKTWCEAKGHAAGSETSFGTKLRSVSSGIETEQRLRFVLTDKGVHLYEGGERVKRRARFYMGVKVKPDHGLDWKPDVAGCVDSVTAGRVESEGLAPAWEKGSA